MAQRLARHSIYNLLGQGVPLVAAFVAIPILIRNLGTDRFGVITLAWVLVGYFSLFDLGLGRALTQVVAAKASASGGHRAPAIVWPALMLMLVLGLVGALVLAAIAPLLVHSILKIPDWLQKETLRSFYVIAAVVPAVVVTAGLAGILTAFHRFGLINAIRAPMGVFTYLAPLAVLPFSNSLVAVMTMLAIGRIVACVAHIAACRHVLPKVSFASVASYSEVRPLLRIGAWMTVSNIIGPVMIYVDRFVIGSMLSISAVAYYATPFELVTKLLIIPAAIIGVLFPAIAASYLVDNDRVVHLFTRATKYVAMVLFPVILIVVAFANQGLEWWLGVEFARNSTSVLQLLAVGVFINSIAQVFFTLIQGIGRPDLSAKLHAIELPIYILVLWWSIEQYGVLGAAVAWICRVAIDALLLLWLSSRFVISVGLLLRIGAGVILAAGLFVAPLVINGALNRASFVGCMLIACALFVWRIVFVDDERVFIRTCLSMRDTRGRG